MDGKILNRGFIIQTAKELNTSGGSHEITLGGAEIRYVHIVVDLKVNYDRECGKVIEPKYGGKSRRKMLNFTGAELAFAKMFNIYMDFGRRFRSYDVVLPDGRTVDVKHTDQDQGRLVASLETSRRQIPDLFALIVEEFKSMNLSPSPSPSPTRGEGRGEYGRGPDSRFKGHCGDSKESIELAGKLQLNEDFTAREVTGSEFGEPGGLISVPLEGDRS